MAFFVFCGTANVNRSTIQQLTIPLEMEDQHERIIEEDMNIYPTVPQNTKKAISILVGIVQFGLSSITLIATAHSTSWLIILGLLKLGMAIFVFCGTVG